PSGGARLHRGRQVPRLAGRLLRRGLRAARDRPSPRPHPRDRLRVRLLPRPRSPRVRLEHPRRGAGGGRIQRALRARLAHPSWERHRSGTPRASGGRAPRLQGWLLRRRHLERRLEHVGDPESVVRESARVIRRGGLLAFNMPNYRWIYEGHYNTPWIPAMSKPLARRYVALLGRDPSYVDTLHFLSPRIIKRILARVPELRLTHPLERGCTDFLALRIGAYLDAAGARGSDRRLPVFRALHWISLRRSFKSAMGAFATVTGVYHEMHLI